MATRTCGSPRAGRSPAGKAQRRIVVVKLIGEGRDPLGGQQVQLQCRAGEVGVAHQRAQGHGRGRVRARAGTRPRSPRPARLARPAPRRSRLVSLRGHIGHVHDGAGDRDLLEMKTRSSSWLVPFRIGTRTNRPAVIAVPIGSSSTSPSTAIGTAAPGKLLTRSATGRRRRPSAVWSRQPAFAAKASPSAWRRGTSAPAPRVRLRFARSPGGRAHGNRGRS